MQWRGRNGKYKGKRARSIKAPEKKGEVGVHGIRLLLFDSCQDGDRVRWSCRVVRMVS